MCIFWLAAAFCSPFIDLWCRPRAGGATAPLTLLTFIRLCSQNQYLFSHNRPVRTISPKIAVVAFLISAIREMRRFIAASPRCGLHETSNEGSANTNKHWKQWRWNRVPPNSSKRSPCPSTSSPAKFQTKSVLQWFGVRALEKTEPSTAMRATVSVRWRSRNDLWVSMCPIWVPRKRARIF